MIQMNLLQVQVLNHMSGIQFWRKFNVKMNKNTYNCEPLLCFSLNQI